MAFKLTYKTVDEMMEVIMKILLTTLLLGFIAVCMTGCLKTLSLDIGKGLITFTYEGEPATKSALFEKTRKDGSKTSVMGFESKQLLEKKEEGATP